MAEFTLYIGYKQTSSWSLRGWLAMRKTGAEFEEVTIRYRTAAGKQQLEQISPSGRVPVLVHQTGETLIRVWESLAICDYLAELFPERNLWPADPPARAYARSIAAEMHAGFMPLRQHLSMDLLAHHPGAGHDAPGVAEDIARILHIWRECRETYGQDGPFLFGNFTMADAMYAPVVTRFRTYGIAADAIGDAYMEAVLADPDVRAWDDDAKAHGPMDWGS